METAAGAAGIQQHLLAVVVQAVSLFTVEQSHQRSSRWLLWE